MLRDDHTDPHPVRRSPRPGVRPVLPMPGISAPQGPSGDLAVAWIAERQHGVISSAQLLACGLGPAAIEHRCARGRLHRLHRGVYGVGLRPAGTRSRAMAAVLAIGAGAAVSHLTAGRLLDVLPAGSPEALGRDPIDVSIVGGRNARARDGLRLHRSTSLDGRDLRWLGPVPVTSGARTVLDIADGGDARLVERVLASVLRGRHASETEVRALLARSPGRTGLGVIASLVEAGPAFDRSVAERLLLELLVRADLPRPGMNARVGGFEVDGLWEAERVVVEFDSFTFHGDRIAFRRDRRKSARLQSLGFGVVPVVWEDLVGTPEVVVAVVASVLAVARERLVRVAPG